MPSYNTTHMSIELTHTFCHLPQPDPMTGALTGNIVFSGKSNDKSCDSGHIYYAVADTYVPHKLICFDSAIESLVARGPLLQSLP